MVLGNPGTGKSALIRRFARGYFVEEHATTIEDVLTKSIQVDGARLELRIWDTPSGEHAGPRRLGFTQRQQAHISCADGVLICYSVSDANSFRSALAMFKQIQETRGMLPDLS